MFRIRLSMIAAVSTLGASSSRAPPAMQNDGSAPPGSMAKAALIRVNPLLVAITLPIHVPRFDTIPDARLPVGSEGGHEPAAPDVAAIAANPAPPVADNTLSESHAPPSPPGSRLQPRKMARRLAGTRVAGICLREPRALSPACRSLGLPSCAKSPC